MGRLKHIKSVDDVINERTTAPVEAPVETPTETPAQPGTRPNSPTRPPKRRVNPAPKNRVDIMVGKIISRYNSLIKSEKTSEALGDNMGIPDGYLQRLKDEMEPQDFNRAVRSSQEILQLLATIKQAESEYSEEEIKAKATEIVMETFIGKGIDMADIEFKLEVLGDEDLMQAKEGTIVGQPIDELIAKKQELRQDADKVKLAKEMDIRAIQNALTQGFASSIKDDFVQGDTEIEGVSFSDYYNMMDKVTGQYSQLPEEFIHAALTQSPALGRVELVWDEDKDKYIIEASGYTILILVHEMVKGIYELMSYSRDISGKMSDEEEEEMEKDTETQYSEREGLMFGPGLVKTFKEFFDKVEDNLIEQREINERSPAMLPAVLSKFYQLEDDLFLRTCSSIWNAEDDESQRPYDLFEQFYVQLLDDMDSGNDTYRDDDDPIDTDDTPPTSDDGDDFMQNLLRDVGGISLNMNPMEETLSHIIPFDIYLLLEGYNKATIQKLSDSSSGMTIKEVARIMDQFRSLVKNAKADNELGKVIISDQIQTTVPAVFSARINIDSYPNIDEVQAVVKALRGWSVLPKKTMIKASDIGAAVVELQEILGIEQTGHFDEVTRKAVMDFQSQTASKWGAETKELISTFAKETTSKKKELNDKMKLLNDEKKRITSSEVPDRERVASIIAEITTIAGELDNLNVSEETFKGILNQLYKTTGNVGLGTINALNIEKDLEGLEGVAGGVFKDEFAGGRTVYENEHVKLIRILSKQFCIETRQSFDQGMRKAGLSKTYGWCIASSSYWNYRKSSGTTTKTYYYVVNKKRTANEAKRLLEGGRPPNNRLFFDDLHTCVILVNDDERHFSVEGASNVGTGTGSNQMPFDGVVDFIWPVDHATSTNGEHSKAAGSSVSGRISPETFDSSWWVPSTVEKEKIKRVLKQADYSSIELEEISGRSSGRRSDITNANTFVKATYEQKESFIRSNYINDDGPNKRRQYRMPDHLFAETPSKLKNMYITQSWVGLSDAQFNEIKGTKLVRAHTTFVTRWLLGDDNHAGFIKKMGDHVTRGIGEAKNANALRALIADIKVNMLDQNEIEVLDVSTRAEYEKALVLFHKTAHKATLKPETGVDSNSTGYNDMRLIKQSIEINRLMKSSKVNDDSFNTKLDKIGVTDELLSNISQSGSPSAINDLLGKLPKSLFIGNDEALELLTDAMGKYAGDNNKIKGYLFSKMKNSTKAVFSRILLNDSEKSTNVGGKITHLLKFALEMNSPIEALYFKMKIWSFYDYQSNKPIARDHENIGELWDKVEGRNPIFWEKLTGKSVNARVKRAQLKKDRVAQKKRKGDDREYL